MSHSQLLVLFLLILQSFFIFSCKEYNQYDFGTDHWCCLCVEQSLVGRVCLLRPVLSFEKKKKRKTLASLCSTSFCIPRPNLPVTPGISWLPTSVFQSPEMKRTSFGVCLLLVLVLGGVLGLHRIIQLQLLQHQRSGHRLGLL